MASATTRTVAWKSLTVRVRACKNGFHPDRDWTKKEGRRRKVPPFLYAIAALADRLTFDRSEEHTSELQSLMRISYAVFCLTKKKQQPQFKHTHFCLSNYIKLRNDISIHSTHVKST